LNEQIKQYFSQKSPGTATLHQLQSMPGYRLHLIE